MGMNLCVCHLSTHQCHPDWDDDRYSLDKTIAQFFYKGILPLENKELAFGEDIPPRRPLDFKIWKINIRHIRGEDDEDTEWLRERATSLLELLEANPDYGVYISV